VNITNDDGLTPLLVASHHGQTEVVRALLDHGSNIKDVDPINGDNTLQWALRSCHRPTPKLLIDREVKIIKHVNNINDEAIHQAAILG